MKKSNEPPESDQGIRDSIKRLDAIAERTQKQRLQYFEALSRRIERRKRLRYCWHKLRNLFGKSA